MRLGRYRFFVTLAAMLAASSHGFCQGIPKFGTPVFPGGATQDNSMPSQPLGTPGLDNRSIILRRDPASVVSNSGDLQGKALACANQTGTDVDQFQDCAGQAILTRSQADLVECARQSESKEAFAICAAPDVLGHAANRDQQVALQCAAQSHGDTAGFAVCEGQYQLGLRLTPEQQISIGCVAQTDGQPPEAMACIVGELTARELEKCASGRLGGSEGCFGSNNDLVGRNGWTVRELRQVSRIIPKKLPPLPKLPNLPLPRLPKLPRL